MTSVWKACREFVGIIDDKNDRTDEIGILTSLFLDPQTQSIIAIGAVLIAFALLMKLLSKLSTFMVDILKFILMWMSCMFIFQVLQFFCTPYGIATKIVPYLYQFGIDLPLILNITLP